jgi:DNA-binding MarR family transcriptional regulator
MEQAGLVRRQRSTLDRRAVQVELTRAGHALHARLLKAVISFNQELRAGLSGEDVETLRSLLRQLQDNVGGRDPSSSRANQREKEPLN